MAKKLARDEIQNLLREAGLRVTAPRVAILQHLAMSKHPLSHSDLLALQGEATWDASTTYRTLKTLVQEELALIASRADGIDRYAFVGAGDGDHEHAHFVCDDCGEVSCLPKSVAPKIKADSRWAASVKSANIQLRGECPDCLELEA